MPKPHHQHRARAVVLIEGPDGQRHAYEIGEAPGIPLAVTHHGDGRIEFSGLFLGGAVWQDDLPTVAHQEIALPQ